MTESLLDGKLFIRNVLAHVIEGYYFSGREEIIVKIMCLSHR